MEKPTGLIAKVIDTLHVVNSIETPYSLIEKDIVLQHIRAAYLQLLNVPTSEELGREPLVLPNLTETVIVSKEDTKTKEENSRLQGEVAQLLEQASAYMNSIEQLELALAEEKQKQTNLEQQLTELNKSNQAQKAELEELLSELDEKDQLIEQLKQELELVLLREDELDHIEPEVPFLVPEPIVEKPVEVLVIPEPIIEKPIEVKIVPEPVVIPEPVKIVEKTIEPIIEEVDDILEFTHPTPVKQEQQIPIVAPQPLLFVEENESPKQEKKSLNDLLTEKK
ncbi:MAG: hypothetical protein CVU04_03785, partial [Bacteroidetes bacterium HGW-Bacteroidetes-20]